MAQWQGVHYSDSDVLHMQQEAIRRVRQMQQRARQTLGEGAPPEMGSLPASAGTPDMPAQPTSASVSVFSPGQAAPPAQPVSAPSQGRGASPPGGSLGMGALGALGGRIGQLIEGGEQGQSICRLLDSLLQGDSPTAGALSALGLDGERLLLLGLLLLLWNEQADRTLLLALGYLLL